MTVIVPAHNEALVLDDCLRSIVRQDHGGVVRVVVVANGCSDDTVARARSFREAFRRRGWELFVTPLGEASKPAALNAGERLAGDGVRIYLDADVVLSRNAVAAVLSVLDGRGGVEFASPQLVTAAARSPFTRSYCRIWPRLPYVVGDVIGVGCYAVSAAGRRRWGEFPNIVADDKFARLHFAQSERRVATDASFTVFMPEGLRELVRVRSRWIRANAELSHAFPELSRHDRRRFGGLLRFLVTNPRVWPFVPLFVLTYALAELRALRRPRAWERADRSRARRTAAQADLRSLTPVRLVSDTRDRAGTRTQV